MSAMFSHIYVDVNVILCIVYLENLNCIWVDTVHVDSLTFSNKMTSWPMQMNSSRVEWSLQYVPYLFRFYWFIFFFQTDIKRIWSKLEYWKHFIRLYLELSQLFFCFKLLAFFLVFLCIIRNHVVCIHSNLKCDEYFEKQSKFPISHLEKSKSHREIFRFRPFELCLFIFS